MKALSIRQPWAWLIMHGYKDIENRSWNTKYRGKFLVHAARAFDHEGERWVKETYPEIILPTFYVGLTGLRGGVMGTVELIDVVTESRSPWFTGPFGFKLANPRIVPFQMWWGKLGFFDIPTLADMPLPPE